MLYLKNLNSCLSSRENVKCSGKIVAVRDPIVQAKLPAAALGDECLITLREGRQIRAYVVSFNNEYVTLAPIESLQGIAPADNVECTGKSAAVKIPPSTGCVIDSLGNILYQAPSTLEDAQWRPKREILTPIYNKPPCPLSRMPIVRQLTTGIRALDTLCAIGYGQRIALMAGAGVGKSTLLASIARHAEVDVTVIALVGERGREVNEFVHKGLGQEGIKRSIIVTATSDQSAVQRSFAAASATAIAEFYRAQGKRVLLLVDSLTRTTRAIREVGLAAGEMPVRQGLTPSVYSELPRLLERAGNDSSGSITAIYTLLDTSERELDPLAEEVKSLLDGHISLSNSIVLSGIRPSIDYTTSISRLASQIRTSDEQYSSAAILRIIARLRRDRDIILLGGTPDPELKACLEIERDLRNFLHQPHDEYTSLASANAECLRLGAKFSIMCKL